MNQHLRNYLNSFKQKKSILRVFTISVLFWIIFLTVIAIFFGYLSTKSAEFGASPQDLQKQILANPELATQSLQQLSNFVFTFAGGIISILIFSLLLYSYSRKLIWNYLGKKKTKFWRWNGINVMLTIIYLLFIPIALIIKLLTNLISSNFSVQTSLVINNITNFIIIFLILTFTYLVYYNFNKTYRVFTAVGNTFHLIKVRWYRLWRTFLLISMTGIIIGIIQTFIKNQLTTSFGTIINIALFILFLSWMQVYLIKTINTC